MKFFLIAFLTLAQPVNIEDGILVEPVVPHYTWIEIITKYPFDDSDELPYEIHHIYRSDLLIAASGPQEFHDASITPENNLFFYTANESFGIKSLPNVEDIVNNIEWVDAIYRINRDNPGGIINIEDY